MADPPEKLFQASRFFVERRSKPLPDGTPHAREIVVHPGAVAIIPMIDSDRVCLIKNHRLAVGKTLIELPAGTLEPDEDPADCAARELIEETGFSATRIEKLQKFFMSPGILSESMHLFLATGLQPGEMALEAGEEIERFEVSWTDAIRMVESGEIEDAKTLVGLLIYDRLRRQKTGD